MYFYLMWIGLLPVCVSVNHMHSVSLETRVGALDPLELELLTDALGHVSPGN